MTGLLSAIKLLAEKGYVEFPNIFKNHGIKLNIDEVAFKIGNFEIRWYGLLISGVVLLSIFLALKSCKKYDIDPNDLLDYMIFALPSAIIGLRVYYVIFNFEQYRDNPVSMLYFWEGGLAIYGGIIGGVLALFIAFYHQLFAVTFDESFSRATGVKVGTYKTLLSLLTALTVVLGMRMMGAMLISSLVIFPALSAMRVFKRFRSVVIFAGALAVCCFCVGLIGSYLLSTPVGATVVVCDLAAFLLCAALGRAR